MKQEVIMRVSEAMTKDVHIADPEQTIQQAARTMASLDAGVLPVGEKDHLIGMITDRDIAIRGIAQGKGPDVKVRDVMTEDIKYCFDDQEIEEVTRNMAAIQVRRLPVLNREKRLVGILSLGDIAISPDGKDAGDALRGISRPGGEHTQAADVVR
jgi:CBS domain-containing protein